MHPFSSSFRHLTCRFVAAFAAAHLVSHAAYAADDLGVLSMMETNFEVSSPAVTEYKGQKFMYMNGPGGIYFTADNGKKGWSDPKLSFGKSQFNVGDPAIVKHPTMNQYIMFYTMREKAPTTKVMVDKRTGKKQVVTEQPKNAIGVAYASGCTGSPDGSGLCWNDLSKERPLIGHEYGLRGGASPSVFLDGPRAMLYYRTDPPKSELVRTVVDIRDWKIQDTKSLTFQRYHPFRKKWNTLEPHQQLTINDVDVKPYGKKGYLMVGNFFSLNAIGRWKSDNGINFHMDPYDGNSPILSGVDNHMKAPYLEVGDKKGEFTLYYALGDSTSECSQARIKAGSQIMCTRAIQARKMSEERDPKIFENDYYSEHYVKPDFSSTKPKDDLFSEYQKKEGLTKGKGAAGAPANKRTGKQPATPAEKEDSIWSIFRK